VVSIAHRYHLPLTVSAGRSNVTGAALPVRGGIVLDVCDLNQLLSFDPDSQIVEVEAGMFGDIFEQTIQQEYGMTMGHWPSSFGISTVGGWVACRGAGQLSTRYGKIEDMVYGMDVVLADGRLITVGGAPRSATGPDIQQLFIGSEGTLGVIVRVRLKLHRLPEYGRAIATGFASFADGLEACRQILQHGATPAALRLHDNLESGVQFSLPETNVLLIADEVKRSWWTRCWPSRRASVSNARDSRWRAIRYLSVGWIPAISPGRAPKALPAVRAWWPIPWRWLAAGAIWPLSMRRSSPPLTPSRYPRRLRPSVSRLSMAPVSTFAARRCRR
jgi:FAD/FMN-containing dehydrogenase